MIGWVARKHTRDLPISNFGHESHSVSTTIVKRNTELLLWVDLFSGYLIAKASSSQTAQTIEEKYEECVFRRFGEIEAIR